VEKMIPITSVKKGVISKRLFKETVILGPMEVDLIQ
jgi:hypothetical protein